MIPSISVPKGGGAIRGIGEKFGANPATGTASMTLPIFVSASIFSPALGLSYDSGAGNGPFGLGWTLSVPFIVRKTDKGLPKYQDAEETDVFILSDAEDLVPVIIPQAGGWIRQDFSATRAGAIYAVQRYRPRIEGSFARIERWTNAADGTSFWKTVSANNVTSLYGVGAGGRIADPKDASKIFKWLLEQSYDEKGNVIAYEYAAENRDSVPQVPHEWNRSAGAQRYLKAVHYGNRTPYYPDPQAPSSLALPSDWLFHVVFDYGDHDTAVPTLEPDAPWPVRTDPFSTYRAGFEVRTYRLCRRVLMFHAFAELGPSACLVRSTDFTYAARDDGPGMSFLTRAQQTAYRRNPDGQSYTILDPQTGEALSPRAMPPVTLSYSDAVVDETLRTVDGGALENLPYGVDGTHYQWLDLDSEGLPGVLTEQTGGWFYKRNISNLPRDDSGNVLPDTGPPAGTVRAAFEPVELVATLPSTAALAAGGQQFLDLAGDGRQCLVQTDRFLPGYYARDEDGAWQTFIPFAESPNIAWADPNLRILDLDGDGLADILISEDEVFTWYPSLGKDGFAAGETVRKPFDENDGPALLFADGTQSIYLADLSGDGLTDLVRIRNGEVCYWPNLGYGRFGAKIEMSNAPVFDTPDGFDQARIRLADIDGSGAADIIYLGRSEVVLHFNQSGNAWAVPRVLKQFTAPDNIASVVAVDLLGNGTACLVWSSPLPGDAGRQMRYVDLMGGQKPHLLTGIDNNLGTQTSVQYAASTQFYLRDRLTGTPWLTKLPFPVHVVERVEIRDEVGKTRFVSRYAYHHGYFDGVEREFRGFGMVEQWDTEAFAAFIEDDAANIDSATDLPAVLTRTWLHTGANLPDAGVSAHFKDAYYREPGLAPDALDAMLLQDTTLPAGVTQADGPVLPWTLSPDEEREARRSLKGSVLRQEIYALDGSAEEPQPYSVSESNLTIELLQPQGQNRHSVFFTHARETIEYRYERKLYEVGAERLADPRVKHSMVLALDAYGNPLQTVEIGYGRRFDSPDPLLTEGDKKKQKQILATLTESRYTNAISAGESYRVPLPAESRTYELLNLAPRANRPNTTNLFRFEEMQQAVQTVGDGQHEIAYEDIHASGVQGADPYRRRIAETRVLYRKDDLSAALPLGTAEPLALPYESYRLAFTPGLLAVLGAKISPPDATSLLTGSTGAFLDLDGDGQLWSPSGRVFFSPDLAHPDAVFARGHRYLACAAQDPFGNISLVSYDPYELFVAQTTDALGNVTTAQYDYRVLLPDLVTDPNGNRTAIAFDVLGLAAGSAVMGKAAGPGGKAEGDSLEGFVPDLTDSVIAAFLNDPVAPATDLLGNATTRTIYDVNRYARTGQPVFTATLARETHVADLAPGQQTKVQIAFSYSDGAGRAIQKKVQAEPGPVESGGPDVASRWTASGWTIFNNKDKPVRQYEPFFTAAHDFEFAVQRGVSPTLFYDPRMRVAATLHPNHTYEKVLFDPWWQQTWDVNDTVTLDPTADPDVAPWFARLEANAYSPSWHALRSDAAYAAQAALRWPDAAVRQAETEAAAKAAAHANTPANAHFDVLGRAFLTVADNGAEKHLTRVEQDIQGYRRAATDALGRIAVTADFDMLGAVLQQASMEAGDRWTLYDAGVRPIRAWDSRGHTFRTEYDALRRPVRAFVQGTDTQDPAKEILFAKTEYGEGQPNDAALNLRTRVFRVSDGAGILTSMGVNPMTGADEAYDFKGNLLCSTRQFAQDYKTVPDWAGNPALEPDIFVASTVYDALNRPVTLTMPDMSAVKPIYNEANLLAGLAVNLQGAATLSSFVTGIVYNAKGQRELIEYGNGTSTAYTYDPDTYRLTQLYTARSASAFPGDDPTPPNPPRGVQNLSYIYDPTGNISAIRDGAQQTVYFNNQVVPPDADYVYDPLYRLIAAQGREHIGQTTLPQTTWNDEFRIHLPHPQDGQAMRLYNETYAYDAVGNFLHLVHTAQNGNWTRDYFYEEPSLIESSAVSNRLSRTAVGSASETYSHDAHGNITAMPHLAAMVWDFMDRLQSADLGGGGAVFFLYDSSGQRVRKIVERQNGTKQEERFYIGTGYEVYREYDGAGANAILERQTLHIADGVQRLALVETRTKGDDGLPAQLVRYQFSNHLGSACLELDDAGQVISYEEYYPYGSTSYQAGRSTAEVSLKRYRYTGKERDEETGITYHGARYYAPWLGRWTSADPAGLAAGMNLYRYADANPVRFNDPAGLEPKTTYLGSSRDDKYVARLESTWGGNQYWSEEGSNGAGWYVRTEGNTILEPVRKLYPIQPGDITYGLDLGEVPKRDVWVEMNKDKDEDDDPAQRTLLPTAGNKVLDKYFAQQGGKKDWVDVDLDALDENGRHLWSCRNENNPDDCRVNDYVKLPVGTSDVEMQMAAGGAGKIFGGLARLLGIGAEVVSDEATLAAKAAGNRAESGTFEIVNNSPRNSIGELARETGGRVAIERVVPEGFEYDGRNMIVHEGEAYYQSRFGTSGKKAGAWFRFYGVDSKGVRQIGWVGKQQIAVEPFDPYLYERPDLSGTRVMGPKETGTAAEANEWLRRRGVNLFFE